MATTLTLPSHVIGSDGEQPFPPEHALKLIDRNAWLEPMCNLYSHTSAQSQAREMAKVLRDLTGNQQPLPGIFPDYPAPIVRTGSDGVRELAMARWGMPSPAFVLKGKKVDSGVTNIRNVKSPHWRRWLGEANRCLVPFTSFSEYKTTEDGKKVPVWFAFDDTRPLAFFAGIWTNWTSVRKVKEGEITADLFAFLTCEPNKEVAAIHPKAMPVILTNPDEFETWLTDPWDSASKLQRPLPYDLAGLKQTVSALTTEAATTPKPIKIGVMPYTALDVGPEAAGLDAQRYAAALAAYFMAIDVFSRTGDYIDSYFDYLDNPPDSKRVQGGAPIFLAASLASYVDLNAQALREANQLSRILSLCKDEATVDNDRVSQASIGANSTVEVAALAATQDLGVAPNAQIINNITVKEVSPDKARSDYETMYKKLSLRDPSVNGSVRRAADAYAQESCLIKKGTQNEFLLNAPLRAIVLAAKEISLRPIHWVDIGAKYREALTLVRDRYQAGEDPNVVQAVALNVLDEFNDVYRAAELRRIICRRTFDHPLCAMEQKDFQHLAKLPRAGVKIDFKQLIVEMQQ